jgi:hypothetical protein
MPSLLKSIARPFVTGLRERALQSGRDEEQPVFHLSKETTMASKATTISSTEATQPKSAIERREELPRSTSDQDIRNHAYGIYLQRGGQPGNELEDWLQAERELSPSSTPGVSQCGS